jgi:hypothetical protein
MEMSQPGEVSTNGSVHGGGQAASAHQRSQLPQPLRVEGQRDLLLRQDRVAWLTTLTDSEAPAPNSVWFVADTDALVVFAEPTSRKVHNIGSRPLVCLHPLSRLRSATASGESNPLDSTPEGRC